MTFYSDDPNKPCSPHETDSQDFLDPFMDLLPLFPQYSPCSSNQDSSSISSPINSHFDDNLTIDTTAAATAAATTTDNNHYPLSYNTQILSTAEKSSGLQIQVSGIPSSGAKSRVETQIKFHLKLMTVDRKEVQEWPYIRLHESMLVRSHQRKTQQQQNRSMDGSVATIVSDESKVLRLEAKVVCASNTDQPIRMCVGCVQRERKRAKRSKDKKQQNEALSQEQVSEAERNRILLFNCNPIIDFSSGWTNLPTRITCYCRHHNEKVGFRVCFVLKNYTGDIIADGMSPPIMITDDHKSSRQKNGASRKRSREECGQDISRPNTPAASRRGSVSTTIIADDKKPSFQITPIQVPMTTAVSMLPIATNNNNATSENEDMEMATPNSIDFMSVLTNSNSSSSNSIYNDFFLPPPLPLTSSSVSNTLATPIPTNTPVLDTNEEEESWPFNRRRRTIAGYTPTDVLDLNTLNHRLSDLCANVPQLKKLVPVQGPTYGGIEITLLGSGFYQDLTCLFGERAATTVFWNANTMVCILPPAPQTGPVVVSFKEHPLFLEGQEVSIFTYFDASDQALMELALQVVGLKMTGKLQNAKHVAMSIVQGGDQVTASNHAPSQQSVMEAVELADQPDLLHTNTSGQTLLHLAVQLRYVELVKLLLSKSAALRQGELVNVQDMNEMTALHFACQAGSVEMTRILLQAGANAHLESKWGSAQNLAAAAGSELLGVLDLYAIKRRPSSRRNSIKSHLMHRFHSLSETTTVMACNAAAPAMESDGLGLVRQKIDRRLYLFWLPVLIVAIGLLFVQMFGQPVLLNPILELFPTIYPHHHQRIPIL